jgi:hypothetical protein
MRKDESRPAMVIERGQLRSVRETSWDDSESPPDPLPHVLGLLLCLLDGAERRHSVRIRWCKIGVSH